MKVFNNDRLLAQILLLALLAACIWVLMPFLSALFWAAVLAFASWPIMRLLTRALKGNTSLAAAILTGVWIFLIAMPLVWLGFNIADHIREGMELFKNLRVTGIPEAPTWLEKVPFIGDRLVAYWSTLDKQGSVWLANIKPYTGQVGNWLLARSARIGAGILELALSVILVFFFYRDGPRLAAFAEDLLQRLIGDRAQHYTTLIAGTIQRVVNGVIGTAVAQALVALFGFWVAGVPGAIFLAILTFMLSLIPMGPPLVWAPAAAWLFWQDQVGMGIFLSLWGFLVISSVDNFLKPYLISRGGNLPLVVVLMGVFGGLFAFGFMGLFLGPTLLAVAYSLVSDWISTSQPLLLGQTTTPCAEPKKNAQGDA